MRLYAEIKKVEEQDDGTLKVYGVASSECVDSAGEIVLASAMRRAIPDYMRFGAVREMHDAKKAAGTAVSCAVEDDGCTYLEAIVVDSEAIKKVQYNVYKGFSIGGKTLHREGKTIDELRLTEISLVDRPCNPEAVFSITKLENEKISELQKFMSQEIWDTRTALEALMICSNLLEAELSEPENETAQAEMLQAAIARLKEFVASEIAEDHTMDTNKVDEREDVNPKEGKQKYGDVKFADEKNKKYPIDTEEHIRAAWNYINKPKNAEKYNPEDVKSIKSHIVSAWKNKIDKDGPPSADTKKGENMEDIEKVGKKFSKANLEKMQLCYKSAMEAHAALGKSMSDFSKMWDGKEEGEDDGKDNKKTENTEDTMKLDHETTEKLEKFSTLITDFEKLKAELADLKAQKPLKSIPISKGEDTTIDPKVDELKKVFESENPLDIIKAIHAHGGLRVAEK